MRSEKHIELAHGNGGLLMQRLIREVLLKYFPTPELTPLADAALLTLSQERIAFTTDSYVVNPLLFPGGDIGSLAINGTVNDLSVMGAIPQYLSCALILEEGLELAVLEQILQSMRRSAENAGIKIVTGDTKVVERGAAPRIFINTAGIGLLHPNAPAGNIEVGDKIIISGSIGDHGIAVLSARGEFDLQMEITSDCAPLNHLITKVLDSGVKIKFMRDPTRGGLATVLNEIVRNKNFGIEIIESAIPLKPQVAEVCEILGFDPLYIANEGKVLMVIAEGEAEKTLELLQQHPLGRDAAIIGEITTAPAGKVIMETRVSGHRIIDMLITDQFPRIC
ncbi:MAG: hydrogenase expression/formation protein HypE [Candidatus Sumerlaeia bacterium]|nr:hydrogenase expression/formation protein HypE [Candidatus Sumerlaeia bacterium]